jgi:hypothetical protein
MQRRLLHPARFTAALTPSVRLDEGLFNCAFGVWLAFSKMA